MRILFFIDTLGLGGVIRQLSLLAGGLQEKGHQVSVLALYPVDRDWGSMWEAPQVRVRVLYESRPGHIIPESAGLVRATLELRRLIKTERIQVLYAFQGHTARLISWLAVCSVPGTKIVWGVQGSTPERRRGGYRQKRSPSLYVNKWVSPYVPLMISNSFEGLASRRRLGYRCKSEIVINNGIDTDKFRPDPSARGIVRREWGIPGDSPLIGIAARLSPVKGHADFLKAASLLLRERGDARFVCIGDGDEPYRNELKLLGRDFGLGDLILWAGVREDMPSVLNALDVLCSSSHSEGFPNVIGEAMACGVPCVVTDAGDSALIVADLGTVVPPGDPAALAQGLGGMLDMLPKVRRDDLRRRIEENFTLEKMIEETEKALEEMLNG
ncbi:MAG: glycosyltransferase [Thermodesulfobacteriota bacterium]